MNVLRTQLLPWIKVLACQALVLVAVLSLSRWVTPGTLPVLIGQGAAAAGLGFLLRMPRIWLVVQFLLPVAVVYGDAVPAWAYFAAFVLCALVYWNSASEQVPLTSPIGAHGRRSPISSRPPVRAAWSISAAAWAASSPFLPARIPVLR